MAGPELEEAVAWMEVSLKGLMMKREERKKKVRGKSRTFLIESRYSRKLLE